MIIGISGKIGSGKDTVGKIIQFLTLGESHYTEYNKFLKEVEDDISKGHNPFSDKDFHIKKFADTLKDYVCMAIGCTREQLEDREFKDKELGEEWTRYGYADGFIHKGKVGDVVMNYQSCDKERYEIEYKTNWQTAYKQVMTPRLMLQLMGTDAMRDKVHSNFWVNALMSSYNSKYQALDILGMTDGNTKRLYEIPESNWIITDVRFPNELKAVKDRNGITIRVVRNMWYRLEEWEGKKYHQWSNTMDFTGNVFTCNISIRDKHSAYLEFLKEFTPKQHESETALDSFKTNYTIYNNGTIEDLVEKVREILIKEKIL